MIFKKIFKEVEGYQQVIGYELDQEIFNVFGRTFKNKAVILGIDNLINMKGDDHRRLREVAEKFGNMSPKQQRAVVKAMAQLNMALDDLLYFSESR